jgi:glucose-6-phosphate isomerase
MNSVDAAWHALRHHKDDIQSVSLNQLFAHDGRRFESFSLRLDDLLVDFSKNLITKETLRLLRQTAEWAGFAQRREATLSGAEVNSSEDRAALHTALRAPREAVIKVDGRNIMPDVHGVLDQTRAFADSVRNGGVTGSSGAIFNDVVHIGIGGSVLGPAMITEALTPYHHERIRIHFVSNVDGAHLHDTLRNLEPETTLFLIASKTFTTQETMLNAGSARRWVTEALGEDAVAQHFVALSSNLEAATRFGISDERAFGFWDWVGGRYSSWSAVGLPVAIAIGPDGFAALLAGARHMDEHFASAPLEENIPATLGLIDVWYRSILGYASRAIIPYDQRLSRLTAHLQQVDMESNGKSRRIDGGPVTEPTAGVVWGGVGTNVQHSFFQLLHQGSDIVPCDFLVAAQPHEDMPGHHDMLLANCLAQSQALMTGRSLEEAKAFLLAEGMAPAKAIALAPHRVFGGNRPSTTLLYRKLDPRTMGMLIALYEHKASVQGALWGINSFDQWGVELGKELANRLLPAIKGATPELADGSTLGLLDDLRRLRSA